MRVIEVEGNDPGSIANAIASHGACRIRHFISNDVARGLHDEADSLDAAITFANAQMGVGRGMTTHAPLRGDRTLWLDDEKCARGPEFLGTLSALSQSLRAALRMPIHGVEAQYAIYPPGARYSRHRDRMQADGSRMISWVTYLNLDWQSEHGGMLRLHGEDAQFTDIEPLFGTSVCFLSDIEHEVLESHQRRLSIAGWMRRLD